MKNLVIDQGNTRTKIAIYQSNNMLECISIENDLSAEVVNQLQYKHSPQNAILSSVTKDRNILDLLRKSSIKTIELTETTTLPFKNLYTSRATLGKDRLAAVAGAFHQYPNRNCLIIDAGTAITYDIITETGEYLGGSISPGLQTRFKALHTFTSKLPLVEVNPSLGITGADTYSSINSGVYYGVLFEIDGFISLYKKYYQDLFVFLTGGDALVLEKNIKNSIFVDQNIVLSGLNSLLENNNAE